MIEIEVIEQDLDNAIKEIQIGDKPRACCCVLAQAGIRQIGGFFNCCDDYINIKIGEDSKTLRPTVGSQNSMGYLVNDFDNKDYEGIRARLPLKIRLE